MVWFLDGGVPNVLGENAQYCTLPRWEDADEGTLESQLAERIGKSVPVGRPKLRLPDHAGKDVPGCKEVHG